ncbi:hypothetical protein J437_LFUL009535 [Ladona fulva]|uniref:Uncharacterized protein n=1 Tax=Ladona fulva TaxID=123851 RepID=A0A8K0K5Y5_LADFU|nr:hypothetical protein J437_LFUL009535 [Ladona fulva]
MFWTLLRTEVLDGFVTRTYFSSIVDFIWKKITFFREINMPRTRRRNRSVSRSRSRSNSYSYEKDAKRRRVDSPYGSRYQHPASNRSVSRSRSHSNSYPYDRETKRRRVDSPYGSRYQHPASPYQRRTYSKDLRNWFVDPVKRTSNGSFASFPADSLVLFNE